MSFFPTLFFTLFDNLFLGILPPPGSFYMITEDNFFMITEDGQLMVTE